MRPYSMHICSLALLCCACLAPLTLAQAQETPFPRQAPGGPDAPAGGWPGTPSTALPGLDLLFPTWASAIEVDYGAELSDLWKTPERALGRSVGPASPDDPFHDGDLLNRTGGVFDIVSLGRGGRATVRFAYPLWDGPGYDFAVFENAFNDTALELAYVEVSSDGAAFVRFPVRSLVPEPRQAFSGLDTRQLQGFAGKYRIGYGTPFDLAQLRGLPAASVLDFEAIRFVRVVDVVGDGSERDSAGAPIYDPYPTLGSAGFDLEAVGALRALPLAVDATFAGGPRLVWRALPEGAAQTLERSTDLADWTRDTASEAAAETSESTTATSAPIDWPTEATFWRAAGEPQP